MKLYKKYFLSLLLVVPALVSCSDNDKYTLDSQIAWPSEKFSSTIQFVSRLDNTSMFTSDADLAAVKNYTLNDLKGKSWLTILDRTDQEGVKKVSSIAAEGLRMMGFALNSVSNATDAQGSCLFLNQPAHSILGVPCGKGCYVTSLSPKMQGFRTDRDENGQELGKTPVSFNINFRTVRFNSQEQIDAFGGTEGVLSSLKRGGGMNMLVIGTVKKSLFEKLQATVAATDSFFVLTKVADGSEYSVFMLAEQHFWAFRSVDEVSLGNGINSYEISVMW